MARNQRSERPCVGSVKVSSGVKATRITMTSGASTNRMTKLWNVRASGPFLRMMLCPGALAHAARVAPFEHAVVGEHHHEIGDEQQHGDGRAERPVHRTEELVVHGGGRH